MGKGKGITNFTLDSSHIYVDFQADPALLSSIQLVDAKYSLYYVVGWGGAM